MKITSLHIMNYGGISDLKLSLNQINVIFGKCGTGKSSIMSALKFVLTGEVSKDDIKVGTQNATVEVFFEDGNSISRIRKSDSTTCKSNGKTCTATALNKFIESKIGASVKIITAMCGADFLETLGQKDLTNFVLSILPVNITFDVMIQFLEEHLSRKVVSTEKQFLTEYFDTAAVITLSDIDTAYKKICDNRRIKSAELERAKIRCQFDNQRLPNETKDELNLQMGTISVAEARSKDYKNQLEVYNRALKAQSDAKERLRELQRQLELLKNVQKPDEKEFQKNKEDKAKFENAIKQSNNIVATNLANIKMFQKTIDNLNKPVCPISEKLICNTDKSGLETELQELVQRNQKAVDDAQAFIVRCNEQIQMRDNFIDNYNSTMLQFTKKESLEKQIHEFVIPNVPEKPVEVMMDDIIVKKHEISQKLQIISEYEAALKAKEEYDKLVKEVELLEFGVLALDVKNGVRSKIMEKSLAPLEKMVNAKAEILRKGFRVAMTSPHGLDIKVSPNGIDFVPMKRVSAGEFIFTAYLIMSVVRQITGVTVLLIDNIDSLDADSMKNFLKLVCQDKEYDTVVISGVDHPDTIDIVKQSGIEPIMMYSSGKVAE